MKHVLIITVMAVAVASVLAHPGHDETAAPLVIAQRDGLPVRPSAGAELPPNRVSVSIEGVSRVIKSNGIPDHSPGTFPRRGNPNTIAPQDYTFRVLLRPKAAAQPVHRGGWWWGVALNGVPFEPGTGETWNNDPRSGWRYEAATGFLNLGLDDHNAHVQPNGSYHYHALPTGLVERRGGEGKSMVLIGWAADGFPVYGAWGHSDPKDVKSPLKKLKSSYRLRKGSRPAEPEGPGGEFDGRFSQDFEYVAGSGDLDECNGREGVTPEFPEGTYHYCISTEFPFVARLWKGEPDPSFSKGDRPPGGPGGLVRGGPPRGILEGGPGGTQQAGAPPRRGSRMVEALDANQDGVIDAAEVGRAGEALKKLDTNGDGKLTEEEFRPGPPPPR